LTASVVITARGVPAISGPGIRALFSHTPIKEVSFVYERNDLLVKAEKYRGFARWISDPAATKLTLNFANELEWQAMQPDEEDVRTRAYDRWRQAGEPEDRDEEFWLLAEQELRNEALG
jgi:hypothetical protein